MPALIVTFSAVFAVLFSPVISWALGKGTPGIFVAQSVDCHHGCAWFGEFISSHRGVVIDDVRYADAGGVPEIKAGATIPVVDVSSALFHGVAYPRYATARDILWPSIWPIALLGLLPFILLMIWVWTVPVRYCRRNGIAGGTA